MKKQNLGDMIFEDMSRRILAGEFKLNEKLPSERLLAEHYQVSRIPVREAIKKLEEHRIVTKKPGSQTVISALPTLPSQEQPSISASAENMDFLLESLHLRKLLESEAARCAAVNVTTQGLARIQQALFESISEITKLKRGEDNCFCEADLAFHKAIAEESGNPLFLQCLNSIPNILNWHQRWSLNYSVPKDDVIPYHALIFESILARNGDKAYDSMFKHLAHVEELIMSSAPQAK